MTQKSIWVIPIKQWWKVKQPWNQKASAITEKKNDALNIATQIAKNQWLELIWQNLDGKIWGRNSFWNDPYPPKG